MVALFLRRRRVWITLALVTLIVGGAFAGSSAVDYFRQADGPAANVFEGTDASLIDLAGFSARRHQTAEGEQLSVSLRLRLTNPGTLDCFLYVLARNTTAEPKVWAIWPPQDPDGAVSAGGHFRGNDPTTGAPVQLTTRWTRITATLPHPSGQSGFDTAMVYIVAADGDTILARPFAL